MGNLTRASRVSCRCDPTMSVREDKPQTKGDLREMKTRNIFTKFSLAMTVIAIVLLVSSRISAAANRTWVAPSGDDNNAFTNANPCKTFAGALAKTNARGEIVVKESGGFGPLGINKSITIDAGRKYAGIQGDSVYIQAGNTDVIVLRGLTIRGFHLSGGGAGIVAVDFGGVLHVENCAISDFDTDGIESGAGTLFVQDTVISDCGQYAINMFYGGTAVIEHSRLENNNVAGMFLYHGAQATVRSTLASGNRQDGFYTAVGTLNLESCVASNNGLIGVVAASFTNQPPAIVVISNSLVTSNQTGLSQNATSVIYSRGNNTVTGNNTDIFGTITPLGGS
jgi:hypothetical protein